MSVAEREPEPPAPAPVPLRRRLPGGRRCATAATCTGGSSCSRSASSTSSTRRSGTCNHGNAAEAFAARARAHRPAEGARHQPRAGDPGVGARLPAADHRRELLLRVAALHRDRRRDDLPVPEVDRRLPAVAQHARVATALALIGFALLPAHAAPAARRALRRPATLTQGLRRHARQGPGVLVVQLRRGEQDLQPVRGDAERALRVGAVVRVRARPPPAALWAKVLAGLYPVTTVTVIVVTANHYFLDAVAGFVVLGIGYVLARSSPGPDAVPRRADRSPSRQSSPSFAQVPAHEEPDREADAAEPRSRGSAARPRVEEPVDAHLVGVQQREQHQHRAERRRTRSA